MSIYRRVVTVLRVVAAGSAAMMASTLAMLLVTANDGLILRYNLSTASAGSLAAIAGASAAVLLLTVAAGALHPVKVSRR